MPSSKFRFTEAGFEYVLGGSRELSLLVRQTSADASAAYRRVPPTRAVHIISRRDPEITRALRGLLAELLHRSGAWTCSETDVIQLAQHELESVGGRIMLIRRRARRATVRDTTPPSQPPQPPPAEPRQCPTDFLVAPSSTTLEAEESVVLLASDLQSAGFGAGTYTWSTTSTKLSLVGAATAAGPQIQNGPSVTVRAGTEPNRAPESGELVEVTRSQSGCTAITKQVTIWIRRCKLYRLAQPKIIAMATDGYLRPTTTVSDPLLPGAYALGFGQDLSFSTGRAQPHGASVGSTTASLEATMRGLLGSFASSDSHGKARRLFDYFLTPQTGVRFWSDPGLTAAAEAHPNIITFVSRSLSAPISPERSAGQTRIHQALESAGWDINAAVAPTDLGVPAFNRGSEPTPFSAATEDWANGLKVMINGIQHAIVVAHDYYYDQCRNEYYIKLEYVFYDVFGLDDDDLREYGYNWGLGSEGITAWWQLQHQHGYVPVITRIAFQREFRVPVAPAASSRRSSP